MNIGRAACKKCGTVIREEVEKDVKCPGCGRVFKIPNTPKYTRPAAVLRGRSLGRMTFGSEIKGLLNGAPSRVSGEGTQWEIPKSARQKQRTSQGVEVSFFPERGEAEVMRESNWLWVIAYYPGHSSLEQISRTIADEVLILESALPLCQYKDTIEGLGVFTKIFEENLNNGILEIKLEK